MYKISDKIFKILVDKNIGFIDFSCAALEYVAMFPIKPRISWEIHVSSYNGLKTLQRSSDDWSHVAQSGLCWVLIGGGVETCPQSNQRALPLCTCPGGSYVSDFLFEQHVELGKVWGSRGLVYHQGIPELMASIYIWSCYDLPAKAERGGLSLG